MPMTIEQLDVCMKEAARFLSAAALANRAITPPHQEWGNKETAAAKRASMDLSRALSNLRRTAQ